MQSRGEEVGRNLLCAVTLSVTPVVDDTIALGKGLVLRLAIVIQALQFRELSHCVEECSLSTLISMRNGLPFAKKVDFLEEGLEACHQRCIPGAIILLAMLRTVEAVERML